MEKFCMAFLILFQFVVPVSLQYCKGIDGKSVCCDGYKLNPEQNKCILCDRGFRGENCDTKCPYPTYGEVCQSVCSCNVTYCDHVNGCTESSEEHFSKEFNYTSVPEDLINKVNIDKSSSSVRLENTTNFQTTKNTQSKRISNLMYAIIGLTVVSLITSMMYLYTRLLEKRLKNIHTV